MGGDGGAARSDAGGMTLSTHPGTLLHPPDHVHVAEPKHNSVSAQDAHGFGVGVCVGVGVGDHGCVGRVSQSV